MTTTAAVAGASGYAGGELLRLLAGHPGMTVTAAAAGAKAGQALLDVHPQLRGAIDAATGRPAYDHHVLTAATPADLAADVVFLALPHGQSAALVARMPGAGLIVDLGADFRLTDPRAWTDYYGGPHAGSWTYGLPELPGRRGVIAGSTRIANPGCYPTAVGLALAPLAAAGLVDVGDIVVVAASGTSGAGRTPSDALLASQVMSSMSAYKVGGAHQHTPEMEQTISTAAGRPARVSFTPLLAPMPRGILATCTAPLAPGATQAAIAAAMADAYRDEPFVHVLPAGQWPRTASVHGSNHVHLQAAVDEHARRAVVVAALDNLVKGAAGQALQNANIALGLPQTLGLSTVGVAP